MTIRYDLPRVPSHTQPSPFNHDAAKWGLVGGIAGNFLAGAIATTALFSGSGVLAVGAFLLSPLLALGGAYLAAQQGAKIGIQKQQQELQDGRTVSDPTYLNKGIVTGIAVGAALDMALSLIGIPGFGLSILGAIGGSVLHKTELQKDFDLATAQQDYNRSQAPARGYGLGVVQYKDSVSPQEAQALETNQAARPSHTETLAQSENTPLEAGR